MSTKAILKLVLAMATLPSSRSIREEPSTTSGSIETCPTWTYQQKNSSTCTCGNYLKEVVICDNETMNVKLMKCYCMTSSDADNAEVVVGNCVYNCGLNSSIKTYYSITRDMSALDNESCGIYNRQGQMCSRCKEGHGVAVYSYNYYCTECSDYSVNWIQYLGITLLPLTLFYIAVAIVNLDTTQTILSCYILFGQIITAPIISILYDFQSKGSISLCLITTVYGIWNLDFGRSLYKPFCLHPDLSTHQVIALDYLIAVYPLLLILLTYLLVRLHDSYRLAVVICRPFYCCIRHVQKEMNIRASLIDVFATFLLLSNVKFLNVSFDLMSVPVTIKNSTGHSLPHKYTYFNGSMEYLGREHLPYFVLGVAVLFVFNVLPILLLCLYPIRCFQRCLNCCSLSSSSLHIFMDTFQGCYKTTPRDYRHMSSLNLLFRLVTFVAFYTTKNQSYFTLLGILSSSMMFITMAVRPYKSNMRTNVEGLTFLLIAVLSFLISSSKPQIHVNHCYRDFYLALKGWICLVPTAVIVLWMSHLVITNSKLKKRMLLYMSAWKCCKTFHDNNEESPLLSVN